ncbi:MAG: AEC family transporter [Clostridiales Family XIII bacterium]|jgi:predicted permease|nr:AEC family transporter [Clostridiales Family XIII bacterium]
MVIGRILGIFCIIFIGFGANKIGWLPAEAARYLSRIIINIAAPCMVVSVMSSQDLTGGKLHEILLLLGIGALQYTIVILLSFPLARLLRPPKEDRGIFRNFLTFTNNGFMGLPVGLAIFGGLGMFYMVIINCVVQVFIFTFGIWNVKNGMKHGGAGTDSAPPHGPKEMLKDMINPAILALLVGFALLIFQIKLPGAVTDVLDSVGAMMAPLSMMVIGIQLTESKLSAVVADRRLIAMAAIRLIGLGGICFLLLLPLYMNGVLSSMLIGALLLNILLPCATVPVMFAEEYGGNVKLAAEGTFLTTLFSIITIPVVGVLLEML